MEVRHETYGHAWPPSCVTPSLQGSRHAPPDTLGGESHRRLHVIGTGFTQDAFQASQLDLNVGRLSVVAFLSFFGAAIVVPLPGALHGRQEEHSNHAYAGSKSDGSPPRMPMGKLSDPCPMQDEMCHNHHDEQV